jgi:hypothetical protein
LFDLQNQDLIDVLYHRYLTVGDNTYRKSNAVSQAEFARGQLVFSETV